MGTKEIQEWQGILGVDTDGVFGTETLKASKAAVGIQDTTPPPANSATRMSNRGLAFLAANEGVVPGPYLDSVDVWTCGIGHTAAAGSPDPYDLSRGMPDDLYDATVACISLFGRDLKPYEEAVRNAFTVNLTQEEFDAALSFHYNTGAIATATWVQTMNAGNKALASEQIMNWSSPPEVIPRREKEQKLFRDGVHATDATVVWQVDTAGNVIWKAAGSAAFQRIVDYLNLEGRTPQ